MEEKTLNVPYIEFVEGVHAKLILDAVKSLIVEYDAYCSDSIKALLGLPVNNKAVIFNAGND